MRWWLIHVLKRLVRWLEPVDESAIDVEARRLVAAQQARDRRGDHKRRVVLSELTKRFPEARTRDLALAVERVMQEYP